MVSIGSLAALKNRIRNAKRVSFLVGAPFSWHNGSGVPPVSGVVEIVRTFALKHGATTLARLDDQLGNAALAQQYQQAIQFLYQEFDASAVAEIIFQAVSQARVVGAAPITRQTVTDGAATDWNLTPGQIGLAKWMKSRPDEKRGSVFTTNFDPMIGLALLQEGLTPSVNVFPLGGPISAPKHLAPNPVSVFHLHGYWHGGPTLHLPEQLNATRAELKSSIENHLNRTNLFVMAYSGWDDILTTAIANRLSDSSLSADERGAVTWCFYGSNQAELREHNAALFEKFKDGITLGNIQFFCGVDCHTFFDDLIADMSLSPPATAPKVASPLPGWEVLSKDDLTALPPLTGPEAVRYFDGAVPTWRHAISPLIPRLSHVTALATQITSGLADTGASALQLVRAAGGEGKSTALMQAAVDAVLCGSCTLLCRAKNDATLDPEAVASLDTANRWLIVFDDAADMITQLWACADVLHQRGRTNIFFLIAARDSDWQMAHGDRKTWDSRMNRLPDYNLGDLSVENAGKIVDAWAGQGKEGLRALADITLREDRIAKLLKATKSKEVLSDGGSFFGALLDTRFSQPALVDHIVTMLKPLKKVNIERGKGTLFDALVYIANCQAIGMPGLHKRVLASLMGVPENEISASITMPMGLELGAAESRRHILTRHKRIADAIVVAADTRLKADLAAMWTAIVAHTARIGREPGPPLEISYGSIIHAGANMMKNLPQVLDHKRRGEIGIAAAEAARKHSSERVDVISDLARALRNAGYSQEACNLQAYELPRLKGKHELEKYIRGYFNEWATCYGNLRPSDRAAYLKNVWLSCYSVADILPVEIDLKRAKLSCAGLGAALAHLLATDPNDVFAKGRRAATEIALKTKPDPKTKADLDQYKSELDKAGTPMPVDMRQASAWLTATAKTAHDEMIDPLLRSLQKDGTLTFTKLVNAIGQ